MKRTPVKRIARIGRHLVIDARPLRKSRDLRYLFGGQLEVVIHYLGGFEHLLWIVAVLSLAIYGMRLLYTRTSRRKPDPSGETNSLRT